MSQVRLSNQRVVHIVHKKKNFEAVKNVRYSVEHPPKNIEQE